MPMTFNLLHFFGVLKFVRNENIELSRKTPIFNSTYVEGSAEGDPSAGAGAPEVTGKLVLLAFFFSVQLFLMVREFTFPQPMRERETIMTTCLVRF